MNKNVSVRMIIHGTPSPPTPNQRPADPNARLSGYGDLAPAYAVPIWYAPLAQARYVETRAADRAARLAARGNRAKAPPQQHDLVHDNGIALGNWRRGFEYNISGCFVLGCQCFIARIYCDGQYF